MSRFLASTRKSSRLPFTSKGSTGTLRYVVFDVFASRAFLSAGLMEIATISSAWER